MAQRPRPASVLLHSYQRLAAMGLARHVAEYEALGLTVIPPDLAGSAGLTQRLTGAITRLATEGNDGVAPDFETGATHAGIARPDGQLLTHLLGEDEVFTEAVVDPVVLAFAGYALGRPFRLFACRSIIKGPAALPLFLHADQPENTADPLMLNATYLLTDYTKDGGALCYVPGSHKLHRQPLPSEDFSFGGRTFEDALQRAATEHVECADAPDAIPVEAPSGSLVIWSGNTWHGAFARTAPGLRVNLILVFGKPSLRPLESYDDRPAALAAITQTPRLAELLGMPAPELATVDSA